MSNFLFLKKNNKDLFNIISEAEKLFQDEYFEQSVVQVRRFAENLCREILREKVLPDDTFDSMICKIKDNSFENIRMTEFADDLYFIKKQGNASAHSSSANQDGKIALECLERAYEISVFFSNVKYGYDKKLDKTVFSEELLMTGKKSASGNLKVKYAKELKSTRANATKTKAKPSLKSKLEQKPKAKSKKKKDFPTTFVSILIFIILIILGHYFL